MRGDCACFTLPLEWPPMAKAKKASRARKPPGSAAYGGKSRILFSNPATGEGRNPAVSMKIGRNSGTIRLSYDEGKTWPVAKLLFKDSFAYSCLTAMPDGTICCLFDDAAEGS